MTRNLEDLPGLDTFHEENRLFVARLRSDDEDIRRRTLAELDEVDDELAGELLRIVRSPGAEDFRADVAISLGPTLEMCDMELDEEGDLEAGDEWWMMAPLSSEGYRRVTEGLHRIYLDAEIPTLVRRRVLEASVRSPRPWHEGAIRAAWSSEDLGWRSTAVFCMGLHWGVGYSAEIIAGMRQGNDAIRLEAIRAAGRRGIQELGEEVLAVAMDEDADPELRYAATEALPYLGLEAADEALERLLESRDPVLREVAEEAQEELLRERMADELDEDLGLDPEELW